MTEGSASSSVRRKRRAQVTIYYRRLDFCPAIFHIHRRVHLANMQLSEETKVRRFCIYRLCDFLLTLCQERISRVIEVSRVAVH